MNDKDTLSSNGFVAKNSSFRSGSSDEKFSLDGDLVAAKSEIRKDSSSVVFVSPRSKKLEAQFCGKGEEESKKRF
eukprot:scaffold2518_cov178-Amphora_coffeaeformis.AAC.14